jgi:hypothetical protein
MEGPDNATLAQGQVLEGELAVAADEEGKEPEYVQYEGDHEPGLWRASADRSITWLADDVLARARVRSKGRRVQWEIDPRGHEPDVP